MMSAESRLPNPAFTVHRSSFIVSVSALRVELDVAPSNGVGASRAGLERTMPNAALLLCLSAMWYSIPNLAIPCSGPSALYSLLN